MNSAMRLVSFTLLCAAPLLALLAGCGEGHARYTPTSSEARTSLEAALNAWRDGKPYGAIEAKPPVHIADSTWQAGQQLESFEIGPEEDGGDGTKQFPVKLTLKKAKASQDVRYVVHGRDPVWVFSAEEYKHMIDMDNKPVTKTQPKSAGRQSGRDR
jgi:hypothetical protein